MTIDYQIRDEKLQYVINREAAKISALSSNKINKYEYLTGEEILPFNQKQMIEQANSTYSALGTAFEKQIKTIEDQGEKQIKVIQNQGQVILLITIINKIQEFSIHCVPNKPFGSLLKISPKNHIFLKTLNSVFQDIKVWFAD